MEKEDEQKFLDLCIKLRCAESELAEVLDEIKKANEALREMILRKEDGDDKRQ